MGHCLNVHCMYVSRRGAAGKRSVYWGSRLCDTLVVPEVNQFNRGQFAHVSHVDFIGTHKKVPAGTTRRAAVNSRF